ncbi:uncharacterized protein LOC132193895 [Neocloeon triangulifer]|uniref:uncharacterized protein LOC132193895 n=1 Tax=Neocloeon triangulifer TaxID=2078957 RepID=UPI00286ED565|nr:uncharacterized protein LOC132193895 [Neocloeon triangulifer]
MDSNNGYLEPRKVPTPSESGLAKIKLSKVESDDAEYAEPYSVQIEMPSRVPVAPEGRRCSKLALKVTLGVCLLLGVVIAIFTAKQIFREIGLETALNDANQRLDHLDNIFNLHEQYVSYKLWLDCPLARRSAKTMLTLSNGKTYSFHTRKGNWLEAFGKCAERGLHLALLKNQIDVNVVYNKAKEIDPSSWWFVAAKNYGVGNVFDYRWPDGSKLETGDAMWAEYADRSLGCVELITGESIRLHCTRCNDRGVYFICELPTECY